MDNTKTEAVQVGDAFDKRLWESGTLMCGVYRIVVIHENDTIFDLITEGGNTFHKFTDDWMDYTPSAAGQTEAAPEAAEAQTVTCPTCGYEPRSSDWEYAADGSDWWYCPSCEQLFRSGSGYRLPTPANELTDLRARVQALETALQGILKFTQIDMKEQTNIRDLSKYTDVNVKLHCNGFNTPTHGRLGEDDMANAIKRAADALNDDSGKEDSQG